jgi:ketosteroid isomerase-like protein
MDESPCVNASPTSSPETDLLHRAYTAFNARDLETALSTMHPDVLWPNGMEGGYFNGHDEVRAYWTRQWGMIDPRVEPFSFERDEAGRIKVEVHQVVRDRAGAVLSDQRVVHRYTIRDGLIQTMAIEQ